MHLRDRTAHAAQALKEAHRRCSSKSLTYGKMEWDHRRNHVAPAYWVRRVESWRSGCMNLPPYPLYYWTYRKLVRWRIPISKFQCVKCCDAYTQPYSLSQAVWYSQTSECGWIPSLEKATREWVLKDATEILNSFDCIGACVVRVEGCWRYHRSWILFLQLLFNLFKFKTLFFVLFLVGLFLQLFLLLDFILLS